VRFSALLHCKAIFGQKMSGPAVNFHKMKRGSQAALKNFPKSFILLRILFLHTLAIIPDVR
jgi:hypothetical protein